MELIFFAAFAGIMMLTALVFVVYPLRARHAQDGPRPLSAKSTAPLVATVPLLAASLYWLVGSPQALQPQQANAPPTLAAAMAELQRRLSQEPNNLEGWMLLAQAHLAQKEFARAEAALAKAHALAPDDVDLMVAYAEALSLANENRRIEGLAADLLQRALAKNPIHQKALWFMGIRELQQKHYANAVAYWEKLQPQLLAGSNIAKTVQTQIDNARRLGGLATTNTDKALQAKAAITVEVRTAPEIAKDVAPNDAVFVFAKNADDPESPPLAMLRFTAKDLPSTVVLDDAARMLVSRPLSSARRIVVVARLAKSGQALAQSGDYETRSEPIELQTAPEKLSLVLQQKIP